MSAPERIWLQLDPDEPTWCPDPVGDDDVEYVRADKVREQEERAERAEQRAAELEGKVHSCHTRLGDYQFKLACLDNKCARLADLVPYEPPHVRVAPEAQEDEG